MSALPLAQTSLICAIAAILSLPAPVAGRARPQDAALASALERAGRYVQAYERAFSAVVSEEHQVQKLIRADGSVRKLRELRSDMLLVKTGAAWPQVFRDVIEVDKRPVRDRDDRLRRLFLEGSESMMERADDIAKESARYNIGLKRSPTSPLLPLRILDPHLSSRFRFALTGPSLTFEEFGTPSLLRWKGRGKTFDLMTRGSFVLEPESGRVIAATVTAIGPEPTSSIALEVRYAQDPNIDMMVPTGARERFWYAHDPDDDRVEVTYVYSNFRRFQVKVDEQIKTSSRPRPASR